VEYSIPRVRRMWRILACAVYAGRQPIAVSVHRRQRRRYLHPGTAEGPVSARISGASGPSRHGIWAGDGAIVPCQERT
jgi:hypothetical protein